MIKGHISFGKMINGHIALGDSLNGHISGYRGGGALPWYEGDYIVTPKAYTDQVLPTAQKSMHDDITVLKVPKYDVDNPYGGTTVSIAMEV